MLGVWNAPHHQNVLCQWVRPPHTPGPARSSAQREASECVGPRPAEAEQKAHDRADQGLRPSPLAP